MDKKIFDVSVAYGKKDDGKPYWQKIGTAFIDDNGGNVIFNGCLPLPTYDEKYGLRTSVNLFPRKEKDSF